MIDLRIALPIFFSKSVATRACGPYRGIILAFINHGDLILTAQLTPFCWIKMLATCLVPYTVSSVTATLAALEARQQG